MRRYAQRRITQGIDKTHYPDAATEAAGMQVAVAIVLVRDELWLRLEPPHEWLAPREDTHQTLELERTALKDAHVIVMHGPLARACTLAPFGYIVRCGDGYILEVHKKLHQV